jgi:hypothetical protein
VNVDVRLVVGAAALLLTICLALSFVQAARAIQKEHHARFKRIQQRLERDAAALVDRLLHRN